jgi:FMN phosphatase YigB (HAD superfamily)
VVTNGAADVQTQKLDQLGVLALLDAYCISGELGYPQARPAHLRDRGRTMRQAPRQRVDGRRGEADIVGAHRAGIRCVWLHRGRTWPLPDLRPNHIAEGLGEALALLQT